MTKITQQQAAKGTGKPNAPTHIAYHVRDTGDGKGFNIQIDVVPLDGRITLRVAGETNGQ